jgi:hypothetical protein
VYIFFLHSMIQCLSAPLDGCGEQTTQFDITTLISLSQVFKLQGQDAGNETSDGKDSSCADRSKLHGTATRSVGLSAPTRRSTGRAARTGRAGVSAASATGVGLSKGIVSQLPGGKREKLELTWNCSNVRSAVGLMAKTIPPVQWLKK